MIRHRETTTSQQAKWY